MNFTHKFFLAFLIISSFFVHFYKLDKPHSVIFDEVHYGKYITYYLKGKNFFDNHPPLAKLFMAFVVKGKLNPETDFKKIGEKFDKDVPVFSLRFLPAFFGSILIILIYFLTLRITNSHLVSSLAGWGMLFNNCFIVHARWMGPDMILFFFIFLSIYFFLLAESAKSFKKYLLFLFLSGFSIGIAISTKWIGLIPIGIIFIYYFREFLKKETRKKLYPKVKLIVTSFLFIPLLVYYFSFCIHFSLLSKENNKFFKFISLKKFYLTNKEIFEAQLGKLPHTYQSKWYTWPLMKRAVSYYHQVIGKKGKATFIKNITLIGNPILWWLSTLGIFIFFIFYLIRILRGEFFKNPFLTIIPSGYLISLLPFSLIERSLFLYHYFPALIFATIATSYIIDISLSKKIIRNIIFLILFLINFIFLIFLIVRLKTFPLGLLNFSTKLGIFLIILNFLLQLFLIIEGGEKRKNSIITILFLLIFGTFLLFLPISYGIKTTYNNFYYLMWFRSWI